MKKQVLILFFCIPLFFTACASENSTDAKSPNYTDSSETQNTSPAQSISVPISFDSNRWHALSYSSLPSHKISFSPNALLIDVKSSASPLIYPMTNDPKAVTGISIKGHVDRLVNIPDAKKQGEEGWDDFNLRVGLVLLGSNRLNWVQKGFAPDWVKKMFNLAPKEQGIKHIYFLNAVLSPALLNKQRSHPLEKDYLKEHYAWLMDKPGAFSYSQTFNQALLTGALWISVDGDDTKSSFKIKIQEIILNTQ